MQFLTWFAGKKICESKTDFHCSIKNKELTKSLNWERCCNRIAAHSSRCWCSIISLNNRDFKTFMPYNIVSLFWKEISWTASIKGSKKYRSNKLFYILSTYLMKEKII